MRVVTSIEELQGLAASVVTIGNFDGVHCGHRMVIAAVIERARQRKAQSCVVTFDPHPAHLLYDGPRLPLITPLATKLDLLAATGLDLALVLPFTKELRHWTAAQFAERVLHDGLHALEVHEGETFRFGHQAEADIGGLAALGARLGFAVQAYQPYLLRGAAVSSSRIRTLVAKGSVSAARALLGRPFSVHSTPASGRGYGTLYTVPTINLSKYEALLPANGVYVTTLRVGEGPNSRLFRGVTNAGNRPTFGEDSFAVETHLLDFEPITLTEETPLELTFLKKLRDERRFDSPEALRAQIGHDVALAKRYFALCDACGVRAIQS